MLGLGVLGYYALGEIPDTAAAYSVTASSASFAFTGNSAQTSVGRAITASAGTITFSGNNASVVPVRKIVSSSGSFSLTGANVGVTATRFLYAEGYVTGRSVGWGALGELALGEIDTAPRVSFQLVFNVALLNFTRAALTASKGDFVLSGNDASLGRFLGVKATTPMALTVTFNPASLLVRRGLIAGVGTFSGGGQVIDMTRARRGLSVRSGGGASGLRMSSGGGSKGLRIRA